MKHPSIVVVHTLCFKIHIILVPIVFLREHLGLLDENTLCKDIDVQDPVCDELYQTWVKSAKKNLDIFEEVCRSGALFVCFCLSVCLSVCLAIYLSVERHIFQEHNTKL